MDSHKNTDGKVTSLNEAGKETPAEKVDMKAHPANRQSQDSVFTTLFSTRENLLDLHMTLHPEDTAVTVDDIIPVALRNVLVKDLYNDVAYRVGNRIIILVEHQSTICENMPLRLFIYLAREYERIVFGDTDSDKIYKKYQVSIPRPEFYVVYSGKEPWEKDALWLSDAYSEKGRNWMDLEVQVIKRDNIGNRRGKLEEYLLFIQKFYEYKKPGVSEKEAILAAIDDCVKAGILAEFLITRREELVSMLEYEFNMDRYGAVREEEGREIGMEIGEKKGEKKRVVMTVRKALSRGFSDDDIMDLCAVSEEGLDEIKSLLKEYPDKTDEELAIMLLREKELV